MPSNPIYAICEYDYQCGEWTCVEWTVTLQTALDRLQWFLTNDDTATHKIAILTEIPTQPW